LRCVVDDVLHFMLLRASALICSLAVLML